MELLLLNARSIDAGATTPLADFNVSQDCVFEVSVNGGDFQDAASGAPGLSYVDLPTSPRPLPIQVRARPKSKEFWPPETAEYEYRGNGNLAVRKAPDEFHPPRAVALEGAGAAVLVSVFLSRVRDVTRQSLDVLAKVPASRKKAYPKDPWPPAAWAPPPLVNYFFAANPPIENGELRFEKRDMALDPIGMTLEVAGVKAPRMIAVNWPRGVPRTAGAGPTPFLIYFHPDIGQNLGRFYIGPGQGPYPFGWDYLWFGFWRYLHYARGAEQEAPGYADPLAETPFTKGILYQIAAAQREAVLVLPSNAPKEEIGVFRTAESTAVLLREIQAFFFRREGIFAPPEIGRVALAAFSAGNGQVNEFLKQKLNQDHAYSRKHLKELYLFDPPFGVVPKLVQNVERWMESGDAGDKMLRVYSQFVYDGYSTLFPEIRSSKSAFQLDSPDGRRTFAHMPTAAWKSASAKARPPRPLYWKIIKNDDQCTHQLISALMLTDAMRRSGF